MPRKATTTDAPTSDPDSSATTPSTLPDERATAAYAFRCIYGCGVAESHERLAAIPTSTITQIAAAESAGRRHDIPALLSTSTAPATST